VSGIYYFVTIPEFPQEGAHQSSLVELVEYATQEGQEVIPGTPIATVENWWAILQIEANGRGYMQRTFFPPRTNVRIGDPIAIILCDGEDVPYGQPKSMISVLRIKRRKSAKGKQQR
jgi:pyruvate/2-oxoglutarate dehydrogenase complex dihydrolipoamide acyltransferase (E2) component